jgi:hypothetical protein
VVERATLRAAYDETSGGRVAVGELVADPVRRKDRVAEVQGGDALRTHQRRRLWGDPTDDADGHAVTEERRVLRQSGILTALVVDVGAEVLPPRSLPDVVLQVREALVELVVAHR